MIYHLLWFFMASQVVLVIKNPLANAGDVGSIPGSGRSLWRRKWQPAPVFLPRKSYGQRSLVGYNSPWVSKESDMPEHTVVYRRCEPQGCSVVCSGLGERVSPAFCVLLCQWGHQGCFWSESQAVLRISSFKIWLHLTLFIHSASKPLCRTQENLISFPLVDKCNPFPLPLSRTLGSLCIWARKNMHLYQFFVCF